MSNDPTDKSTQSQKMINSSTPGDTGSASGDASRVEMSLQGPRLPGAIMTYQSRLREPPCQYGEKFVAELVPGVETPERG